MNGLLFDVPNLLIYSLFVNFLLVKMEKSCSNKCYSLSYNALGERTIKGLLTTLCQKSFLFRY